MRYVGGSGISSLIGSGERSAATLLRERISGHHSSENVNVVFANEMCHKYPGLCKIKT